jgi:hypothetical protein
MDNEKVEGPTISQYLVDIITEFGRAEPRIMFLVWGDEDDKIHFRHHSASYPEMIGICEYIKNCSLRRMTNDD